VKNLDQQPSNDDVRIELIPLLDVIFCILTFFILVSLQVARQQAIQINLPRASTSSVQTRQNLVVSVDSIGQVYVDQTVVSQDQLFIYLQGYQKSNPQGLMVLYADQSSVYSDVIRVLDLMRSVGGDRVALATQPSDIAPGAPGMAPTGTAPGTMFNTNPAGGISPLPGAPGGLVPSPAAVPGLPGGLPEGAGGLPGGAPGGDSGLPPGMPVGIPGTEPAPGGASVAPVDGGGPGGDAPAVAPDPAVLPPP
jgi:biopolymer transport protein ExbD